MSFTHEQWNARVDDLLHERQRLRAHVELLDAEVTRLSAIPHGIETWFRKHRAACVESLRRQFERKSDPGALAQARAMVEICDRGLAELTRLKGQQ